MVAALTDAAPLASPPPLTLTVSFPVAGAFPATLATTVIGGSSPFSPGQHVMAVAGVGGSARGDVIASRLHVQPLPYSAWTLTPAGSPVIVAVTGASRRRPSSARRRC